MKGSNALTFWQVESTSATDLRQPGADDILPYGIFGDSDRASVRNKIASAMRDYSGAATTQE